jgi:hypothetical protein
MQVGAADAGFLHTNQNIIQAKLRLGHIFEPQPLFAPAFD